MELQGLLYIFFFGSHIQIYDNSQTQIQPFFWKVTLLNQILKFGRLRSLQVAQIYNTPGPQVEKKMAHKPNSIGGVCANLNLRLQGEININQSYLVTQVS